MKLILLGPPGAGKGTQAEKLTKKLNAHHISTGDIFRYNIKNETELGKKAKEYIDSGKLVPDELTIDLVWDKLDSYNKDENIILDGFPRNLNQAEALDKGLKERNDKIDVVININVDDQILIDRIAGRRVCTNCGKTFHITQNPPKVEGVCDNCGSQLIQRDDDKEETVLNRIKVYNDQTAVLIDYYRKKGILATIDGAKKPEDVFKDITESL
ncbi:MAG: adenylate kinase [Tissierellia bacterium]|nr:adenylate kinase [Tissierellia bacterium]